MKILVGKLRAEKGLTLRELESKSGLRKSTINDIENARVSLRLIQLEKLAIALDVRITDLFDSEYK